MIGALRILLLALLVAIGTGTAAHACNEECAEGFVFSDSEGVCIRADTASS